MHFVAVVRDLSCHMMGLLLEGKKVFHILSGDNKMYHMVICANFCDIASQFGTVIHY